MTDNPLPSNLSAWIGGYTGTSYQVDLVHGGSLHHSQASGYDPHMPSLHDRVREGCAVVTPYPEQWATFHKTLDRVGFWDWDESYSPTEPIMDGTSWKVEIEWGDRSHSAHGSNEYPKKWVIFRRALRSLLGGLKFD